LIVFSVFLLYAIVYLNSKVLGREGDAMKSAVLMTVALSLIYGIINPAGAETKIIGKNISYSAQGLAMEGYLSYDEKIKGQRPAVLVVPEWWGLTDYVRRRTRLLAELGYVALAVDMYGQGKVLNTPDEAQKYSSEVMKHFDLAGDRFLAGMDLLKKQPLVDPTRIAAIGYCFGGGIVLNMARQGVDLRGVASFHGVLTPVEPAQPGMIKARILVLAGGADKMVPPQQVEAFKKEMKAAGADFQVISYPGAQHSFTNPESTGLGKKFNLPIGYNALADKESWEELKKFLKEVFEK
jgi:dienelactone hydrolase